MIQTCVSNNIFWNNKMSPSWLGCIVWTLHQLGSAKSFQDGHYVQDWKCTAKLLWLFFSSS